MSDSLNRMDLSSNLEAILKSHGYRQVEKDAEFLSRPELRPVRMQLELLKPEMLLAEHHISSTIVLFGSTQIIAPSEAKLRLANAMAAAAAAPDNTQLAPKQSWRKSCWTSRTIMRRPASLHAWSPCAASRIATFIT